MPHYRSLIFIDGLPLWAEMLFQQRIVPEKYPISPARSKSYGWSERSMRHTAATRYCRHRCKRCRLAPNSVNRKRTLRRASISKIAGPRFELRGAAREIQRDFEFIRIIVPDRFEGGKILNSEYVAEHRQHLDHLIIRIVGD